VSATIGNHTSACNGHETERFFTGGKHCVNVPLSFLLQNTMISFVFDMIIIFQRGINITPKQWRIQTSRLGEQSNKGAPKNLHLLK